MLDMATHQLVVLATEVGEDLQIPVVVIARVKVEVLVGAIVTTVDRDMIMKVMLNQILTADSTKMEDVMIHGATKALVDTLGMEAKFKMKVALVVAQPVTETILDMKETVVLALKDVEVLNTKEKAGEEVAILPLPEMTDGALETMKGQLQAIDLAEERIME